MAEPVKGSNVLLQIYKDGDYQDFLCATECSIDFETESKSVKTIGDGVWKRYRPQSIGYTVNLTGLVRLDVADPVSFDLLDYQMQFTDLTYRMTFEDDAANIKAIYGTGIVEKTSLSGNSDGFANSQFTIKGNGEPTVLDTLDVCALTVTAFTATFYAIGEGGENSYTLAVTVTGSGTLDRIEYQIDGGARQVAGYSAPYYITATSGSHSITVIPVCSNGSDGTSMTQTLTLT